MYPGAPACRIWTSAALCLAARMLSASDGSEYVVERFTASPQVTIRAILQTRDGYLWTGTYKGLGRTDGVRSQVFNLGNTPALSSDSVSVLHEDRAGDLWIGTDDGGVMRYRDGEFQSFGAEQGLTESEVRAICEDREGKLWVGTRRGLFYWHHGRFAVFGTTNFSANSTISALAPGPDESLWIGTLAGLFRVKDGEAESVPALRKRHVQNLAMDANGVLWALVDSARNARIVPGANRTEVEFLPLRYDWFQTGRDGSFWLFGATGTLFRLSGLTNATAVTRFERGKFVSMGDDFEGNVWVGLESDGMYRVRRKQVSTLSMRGGLPVNAVTTILEDRSGRVWLGTFGGGLLSAPSGTTSFEPIGVRALAAVTALRECADGTLWVGNYHRQAFRRDGTNFVAGSGLLGRYRAIYEDRDGGLWAGTLFDGVEHHRDGQLKRYTTRDGLANDRVQSLIQDSGGDMWVGTVRGLNRISAGKVIRFPGEEALARQTIRGLHFDGRGALWIGTMGGGLARCYKDRLQLVTSHHGLPSDGVEQILEDDEGNFWLGTWAGIVRVSRDELDACADGQQNFLKAMTLGPEDGMTMALCGSGFQPSCMKSRAGTLWFCTPGGLVIVDPKAVKPSTNAPVVHIEEATADDRSLALETRSVKVPAGVRRVSFRYTALSFSGPEKIRFRYRLEGYDDGWVSAGAAREATYTRLPAGSYRFRVSAANKDGVWNTAGAVLGVIVVPPWWQTWWFRMMAIAGLAGMVFGAYELRIYQHKKTRTAQELFTRRLIESQEQERKRVAGELHDSLGQSLQVIKGRAQLGLNRAADPSESAKQFEEISNAAGQAIQEVRTISHALRPAELDQLGLAKAIEWMVEKTGATSATRFACEVDGVDGLTPEMEISIYRIAQEGMNNVLKHAHATEAILELKREAGSVRFSIFDNGRGFVKPARSDGRGLVGIAERVRLLGGKFDIQSAPGKGTRLTVTVPT